MGLNQDGTFRTVAGEKTFHKEEPHFTQSNILQSPGLWQALFSCWSALHLKGVAATVLMPVTQFSGYG